MEIDPTVKLPLPTLSPSEKLLPVMELTITGMFSAEVSKLPDFESTKEGLKPPLRFPVNELVNTKLPPSVIELFVFVLMSPENTAPPFMARLTELLSGIFKDGVLI